MHLVPRNKKWRKAKMDSAAWARFPFLGIRGHSPWARTASDCGHWLPTGKSVTPLLHWKDTKFIPKQPKGWTSSALGPHVDFDKTLCTSQAGRGCDPVHETETCQVETAGSCTGQLCHNGTVPRVSKIPRDGRSHAAVANSNWWLGEKVAAGGKGQKKSQLKNKCMNT